MHVCTECGRVCDEDMDFCPACGSTKGANIDPAFIPPEFKVVENPRGKVIVRVSIVRIRLALMLSLLPGIIDIFGLGHLVMKKYLRAAALMACSAFYYYERFTEYFGIDYWYLIGFTIVVFVLQMLDMFRLIKQEIGLKK